MSVARTPSQTVGPYYAIGCCRRDESELVDPAAPGAVVLSGVLLDGAGDPVPDGLVEVFDSSTGRWGRSGTHPDGAFSFVVARPEPTHGSAPQLELVVFARGLLRHQLTRLYFPDEPANEVDPVLRSLGDRASLVAERDGAGLRFDIRLQGDDETVFFAT